MPDNPTDQQAANQVSPSVQTATGDDALPSGKDVYNQIMATIEPDLLETSLEGLAEKYKDETREQKIARFTRYKSAFREYKRKFEAYALKVQAYLRTNKRVAMSSIEEQSHIHEEGVLNFIEKEITALSA
jgi:hypothetical protein